MKKWITQLALLTLSLNPLGCSLKDKGKKFSERSNAGLAAPDRTDGGPLEGEADKVVVRIESERCSFKGQSGITVPEKVSVYNSKTELQINQLLKKYVTPLDAKNPGYVKYLKWWASRNDLSLLCEVMESFRIADTATYSRDEKMAFFINAYNMMTIDLILRHYLELEIPGGRFTKSIRNIKIENEKGEQEILDAEVWDKFTWEIAGKPYTLNDVEKKVLIPMGDARIHFAVNCASKGCPPLLNEAFSARKLNLQLDEMSANFVNNSRYTLFDYDPSFGDGLIDLSKIFQWYAQDFEDDIGGKYQDVRSFLVYYLKRDDIPDKAKILDESIWTLSYLAYDWNLNEQELD